MQSVESRVAFTLLAGGSRGAWRRYRLSALAGLVLEAVETDRHPGRPGYRYRAAGADPVTDARAYRRLATLLAHAVRSRISTREAGRAVAASDASRLAGSDPVQAIALALAQEGFAPEVQQADNDHIEIVLHACPFADAAAEGPATICELHLGLAEGTAQAIGGVEVERPTSTTPIRQAAGWSCAEPLSLSAADDNPLKPDSQA